MASLKLFLFIILCSLSAQAEMKYKIDGEKDDWDKKNLIMKEVGGVGPGVFGSDLDMKDFYFDSDDKYLYIFFSLTPSIGKHYSKQSNSGIVSYFYIDHDDNSKTGANKIDHSKNVKMLGCETRIWVPMFAANKLNPPKTDLLISCEISQWDDKSKSFKHVKHEDYNNTSKYIKFSESGVEIALKKEDLKVKNVKPFKFVVMEWAHMTNKDADSFIYKGKSK